MKSKYLTQELREQFAFYAKFYGYIVKYDKLKQYYGIHDRKNKIIILDLRKLKSKRALISGFCHELAHAHCTKYGKHKRLHTGYLFRLATLKAAKETLKIEKKVDLIGEKICATLWPEIKYTPSYCGRHYMAYVKLIYRRMLVWKASQD